MTDPDHPFSLRPGGPFPSPSIPQEISKDDDEMQNRASSYGAYQPNDNDTQSNGPPMNYGAGPSSSSGGPASSAGRFPSSQYGPPPNFNVETPGGNGSDAQYPSAESSSRGRAATGNNPPFQSQDHYSPPQMPAAQPLFAQHSGAAGGQQASSSRPQSRSTAMNPSVLQPNFPIHGGPNSSQPATRPATSHTQNASNSSNPNTQRSPFSSPIQSPPRSRPAQILLINPTSTPNLTNTILTTLRPILPSQLELIAYTPAYPAPLASETTVDACLSTELILRDLAKYAANNGETVQNYDALLVASFSAHPLINALRESYDVPVIGILEGSIYVSRMLGARFGVLATTNRHKLQQEDAIRALGVSDYYIGSEAVHMSPTELLAVSSGSYAQSSEGGTPREEMAKRIAHAARALVARGADTLIMGSEAMSAEVVIRAAKDAIREEDGRRTVNVVDPVEAGVLVLNALVGMGVPTSKKGVFRGEREGRRGRGQNWL